MNRVVWAEGTFLGQQHLQSWDQHLENSLTLRQKLVNPYSWGIISISVDHQSLAYGRFQLTQVSLIFQDGRYVNFRSSDEDQLTCDLDSPGGEVLSVFLAVPANNNVAGISGYQQRGQLSGWIADYNEIEDLYDSRRTVEVLQAKPNLMLLTDKAALASFNYIKVAEVVNTGDNHYQLVPHYVPPVCRLAASATLLRQLDRVIETLNIKRKQIEAARSDCDGGVAEFAKQDPGYHALLRNLNTLIPQLRHLRNSTDLHPELLYRELCQVAGAFCTFQDQATIDDIPAYNHEELTDVFSRLEKMLALLLELKTTVKTPTIELRLDDTNILFCTEVAVERLRKDTLFLEILHDSDGPDWITDFARQVKVTAYSKIALVVASALPGVRLIHTQRPPAKLSTRSGCEYFRLEPRGDFWNGIIEEKSIAIYRPSAFSAAEIKLVTVEE